MTDADARYAQQVTTNGWIAYAPTLVVCGAILLICGWPYQGFFLVLFWPILIVWSILLVFRKPRQFKIGYPRLCLWMATF